MKSSLLLDKKFVGTHEFRKNLTKLLTKLNKNHSEIVVTRQGKPTAILVSLKNYKEMMDKLDDLGVSLTKLPTP